MAETFSYDNTLPEWRDYARWRLDDLAEDAPYIWNETYDVLLSQFGPVEGLALAAGVIAAILSKELTAFGEAAGIRIARENLDYYQSLPAIIRREPAFGAAVRSKLLRVGALTAGAGAPATRYDVITVCKCYPAGSPSV